MAPGGVVPLVLAVVLAMATPGLLEASVPVVAGPAFDGVWAEGFEEALAWSSVHRDRLVAPLVGGAGLQGWHVEAIGAYEAGVAWAGEALVVSDRASLEAGLASLLEPSGIAADRAHEVPDAFVAPMAALVAAQLELGQRAEALPDSARDPYGFVRATGVSAAWLVGVVEAVLPTIHGAVGEAPEEPVFVDPLGLVILGGSGDDVYEHPALIAHPRGPQLLIEPGGSDTYERGVATTGLVTNPPLPGDLLPGVGAVLALELGGDDRYNQEVANVQVGVGLLVDEAGDDTYSTTTRSWTTAFAANGAALLLDRAGADTYRAKDRGIAYAINRGIAVLADWEGDDVYRAETGSSVGFTHAAAENTASLAVLRDRGGADSYTANGLSAASAEDDSYVLLVDDQGDDDFHLDLVGSGGFGRRYHGEGGLEGPRNRGLAYFLDAGGTDSYTYGSLGTGGDASSFGEGVVRVAATANQKHGVFVDCETPPDAVLPCQQHQSFVLNEIVSNP